MKKIYLLIALCAACIGASAQSSYLKVTHTGSGNVVTDEIAFDGGEVIILDNAVTIAQFLVV
ncbi:hypothetical protein FACS1894162_7740 [Bacteroidia bacterium]|nr:hypothetical protein FACS1894162_7740 [Bacteroidia bacterium]